MRVTIAILAGMMLAAGLNVVPASAQIVGNLLGDGGVVSELLEGDVGGAVGGLVGGDDTDVGDVATIGGGPAGDGSLVNLGLGNGGGNNRNIVELKLGKGGKLGGVNVGGSLGSNLTVGLDLAGLGLDLTVPGLDDILGAGNGGSGGNGGNGTVRVGSLDGAGFGVNCSVNDGRKVLQLATKAKLTRQTIAGWQRAANVRIVPVKLCPQARAQVAKIFKASKKINMLQHAVTADTLISASLGRSRHDAGDVFAVDRQGSELTVYVY